MIEAKGSVERGAIRMAIGQLADYSRFVNGPNAQASSDCSLEQPGEDLLGLLESQDYRRQMGGLTIFRRDGGPKSSSSGREARSRFDARIG